MIKPLLIALFFTLNAALASQHHVVDTLGVSGKGQFVALEEYGYQSHSHSYFVRIRIINVWRKEYVGKPFEVILPAHRPGYLKKARERARYLALEELRRFDISLGKSNSR